MNQGLCPLRTGSKLYIPSTPNNSNETHTFMCLGRTGRFGHAKTALKLIYKI